MQFITVRMIVQEDSLFFLDSPSLSEESRVKVKSESNGLTIKWMRDGGRSNEIICILEVYYLSQLLEIKTTNLCLIPQL